MADYFVAQSGSNTSPYDTWAKAATNLTTALAAATSSGDRVIIQYNDVPTANSAVAGNTTFAFAANGVSCISASNGGGSSWSPQAMGTGSWLGHSSSSFQVSFGGAFRGYLYGITLRNGGSSSQPIGIATADGSHHEAEDCMLWLGTTGLNGRIQFGAASTSGQGFARLINCTLRFGATAQSIEHGRGAFEVQGGSIDTAGSRPSTLITQMNSSGGGALLFEGTDLSYITGTLLASCSENHEAVVMVNCLLGTGVTPLASQTPANKSSGRLWMYDCAIGDEHYHLQYHDALGSLVVDTGIFANDGAQYDGTNRCSWKIVTTSAASYASPFISPWFDQFDDATGGARTPSIEILRDGSTTAYQDDEVWGEWAYKGTSGSARSTFVNDEKTLTASPANQAAGVGTGGWTGEGGSAWSGKLAPASAITIAEIGHIRGRVCVGEPSITVYVDPQTRLA